MGYRSEVVLTVTKECFDTNKNEIKTFIPLCDKASFVPEFDIYLFKLDEIKWYESYPEIQEIESFMDKYPEDISFIRMGEDPDDNETRGDPTEFNIYITRTIEIPDSESIDLEEIYKKEETV